MNIITRRLFWIVLLAATGFGSEIPPDRQAFVDSSVSRLLNCRFDAVLAASDSLMVYDRSEPLAPLMKMAALGLRDLDMDLRVDTSGFEQAYDRTVELLRRYENKQGRDSYSLMLAGLTNAIYASYFLHQNRYFAAVGTGMDAIGMLRTARRLDSTNADVDFVLGLYSYARAELRKRLWMVLFWYGGSKEEGIRRLRVCSRLGRITARPARLALAEIAIKEEAFDRARTLLDSLALEYPASRFLLWSRARYYEAREKPRAAADVYDQLAQSYGKEPLGKRNAFATRALQLDMLMRAGEDSLAQRVGEKVLAECRNRQSSECCGKVCEKIERTVRKSR